MLRQTQWGRALGTGPGDRKQWVSGKGTEMDSCSSVFLTPTQEQTFMAKWVPCPLKQPFPSLLSQCSLCTIEYRYQTWKKDVYSMHFGNLSVSKWSSTIASLTLTSCTCMRSQGPTLPWWSIISKALPVYCPSACHDAWCMLQKSISKIIAQKHGVIALCCYVARKNNLNKTNLDVRAKTTQTGFDTSINPGTSQAGEQKTPTRGQPVAKFSSRRKLLWLQRLGRSYKVSNCSCNIEIHGWWSPPYTGTQLFENLTVFSHLLWNIWAGPYITRGEHSPPLPPQLLSITSPTRPLQEIAPGLHKTLADRRNGIAKF